MDYRFEVVDFVETPIGVVDLRQRSLPDADGRAVMQVHVDGYLLMSSANTVSERALATRALAAHPSAAGPFDVLVGGLGLGYTAHAALHDARVSRVLVLDLLPAVARWMRDGQLPLSSELNADPRLEIAEGDVYARLLGPPTERHDLLLIDVDHAPKDPLHAASAPFYTVEGQRRVMQHLVPGGVLGVWSAEDDDDFARVLDVVYPWSRRERIRWSDASLGAKEDVLFLARAPRAPG